MNVSFLQVVTCMVAGIIAIILLTVRFRLHPFFALLIACFITGIGLEIPVLEILRYIKLGIGDILSKLTLIIVLGTAIGVLLEKNGSTQVMANAILKLVGTKRSSLALSFTGFVVGLPIFCDSGYIVLNGINRSLIKRTGIAVASMSVSLASGLYAVHCLLPPHPGATSAAITLSVDFGKLILYGIIIAIPATLVGYWWAMRAGRGTNSTPNTEETSGEEEHTVEGPSVWLSFLPVIVPIMLMALKSVVGFEENFSGTSPGFINVIGDPAMALAVGLVLAVLISPSKKSVTEHLGVAVEKAAAILIIIGAGGAFGAILAASNIGVHFREALDLKSIGIWFPFLLTTILKTAQGSSTVAIVTASLIVLPMQSLLGLDSPDGRMLTVLAMGAGSMMISHTNDAYFWVISKFSSIDIKTMLRVHSMASILMGLTTMIIVYMLSLIIL